MNLIDMEQSACPELLASKHPHKWEARRIIGQDITNEHQIIATTANAMQATGRNVSPP